MILRNARNRSKTPSLRQQHRCENVKYHLKLEFVFSTTWTLGINGRYLETVPLVCRDKLADLLETFGMCRCGVLINQVYRKICH